MLTNLKNIIISSVLIVIFQFLSFSQDKEYKIGCIAFYNLENLFDTIDSPDTNDEEFTPSGSKNWTGKRYNEKLQNMANVISQIGNEYVPGGPSVIGVSEIENRAVLEALINTPKLKPLNYEIIHYNSPDERGVDVALLYRPGYYKVTNSRAVKVKLPDTTDYTRDILVVSGLFDGEPMHFLVSHWPSRWGGEKRSKPLRITAAKVTRFVVDSILHKEPDAKIIIMGDFNDNPTDESIEEHLKAKGKISDIKKDELYNIMAERYKKGIGTTAYKDSWSLFDQLIITKSLLGEDKSTYKLFKAKIFKKNFLIQNKGRFEGYPMRTFAGGNYLGGYSDHFPVYLFIIKKKKP